MPKATYTPLKGLVQAPGGGFHVNDITVVTATANLDATTFLTVVDNAFTNTNTLTLPSSADTGAIKVIISDTANECNIAATNATTAVVLTNVGDMAICQYNGTEWVVGRSLT